MTARSVSCSSGCTGVVLNHAATTAGGCYQNQRQQQRQRQLQLQLQHSRYADFVRYCSRRWASSESNHRRITFLTDVEGDAEYLDRYVKNSKVLEYAHATSSWDHKIMRNAATLSTTNTHAASTFQTIEFTHSKDMLIFGGDVWDKGGSDLFVIRQLLDLKHRYPTRVHFVLGNRDINKMRLRQELLAPHHEGVWWKPLEMPNPNWSSSHRLQWILANTMGSPKAFELRRSELEHERHQQQYGNEDHHDSRSCSRNRSRNRSCSDMTADDDAVVQSYLDSCHAQTGEMGMLLRQGNLCLKLGKLFVVHGAVPWMVTSATAGSQNGSDGDQSQHYELSMPWLPDPVNSISAQGWMDALNAFGHEQVRQWQISSEDTPTHGVWATKGGFDYWPAETNSYAGLLQYGMGWLPTHERIPTVVYSSWTQTGMPRQFFNPNSREAELTKQFMDDADIQVILSGHQPQGDLPTPIYLDNNKLVMACDTSYSGDMHWMGCDKQEAVGGRGSIAVCEVLIEQCMESGEIHSVTNHGVLSNGVPFETTNLLEHNERVGRLSTSGFDTKRPWWVKADFVDGSQLVSTAEGYHVCNAITMSKSQSD